MSQSDRPGPQQAFESLKVAPFRDRDEKVQLSNLKVKAAKTAKIGLAPYWRPIGALMAPYCNFQT